MNVYCVVCSYFNLTRLFNNQDVDSMLKICLGYYL